MPKQTFEQRIDRRFQSPTLSGNPISVGGGGGGGSLTIHELGGAFHTVTQELDMNGQNIVDVGNVDGVDVSALYVSYTIHAAATSAHGVAGAIVGTTDIQTLTNKTLTSPVIVDFTNATHDHSSIAGGNTISHTALTGVTANQHHNQAHVLANTAALGSDHTVSGLTAGYVLRASGATTALFAQLQHDDLGSVTANQHHNQIHSITGGDHTITGSTLQVVGATATNTLGLLTPSSNPAANSLILKSTAAGGLTLESMTVNGAVTVGQDLMTGASGFRVLYHTHDADHVHVVVNPTGLWSLDEQFGVDIDDNLLVRGYIVGKHAIQLPGATMICHYDGAEPYETNWTGESVGHMGQVGTVAGGTIYRPGKFGKAIRIARSNTNLIPNPSFETSYSTNYDNAGTPVVAYSTLYSVFGTRSALISTNADAEGYGYICTSVTSANANYRFSAYVRGSGVVRIVFTDNVTGTQTSGNTTLTGEWQRINHDATFGAGSTDRRVYLQQVGAGTMTLVTDGWQLEAGTLLSPYTDGSLGNGYAWTGTAHQSTSTRTGGALSYLANGVVQNAAGTVMAWVYRDSGLAFSQRHDVVKITFSTTEKLELYQDSGQLWTCRAYHGSGYVFALNGEAWTPAAGWHHLCVTWDDSTLTIYRNGELWDSTTGLSTGIVFDLANDLIHVGGPAHWDGLVDDLVFADRAISADEVRAIYESNAPVFAETSTWHWRAGRNRVWADTEGLWVLNATGGTVLAAYAGNEDGTGTKSWGGVSLASSDVFIGDDSRGGYVWWDDSAATVTVQGTVIIQAGSSGIANLTDAGDLAIQDDVAWGSDITGRPTELTDGRVSAGLNSSGDVIRRVLPGVAVSPSGAGLYLGSDFLGYYNGSTWKTYMNNSGHFALNSGGSNNYLAWNGTTLTIDGAIVVRSGSSGIASFTDANLDNITNGSTYGRVANTIIAGGLIQVGSGTKDSNLNGWHISSTEIVGQASGVDQVTMGTDGKIVAGAGGVTLERNGLVLDLLASAAIKFTQSGTQVGRVYAINDLDGHVIVEASRSGKGSEATLLAYKSDGVSTIQVQANAISNLISLSGAASILASGNMAINNSSPQAQLHVGAGTDTPVASSVAIYASNAGVTGISARNSTANIEAAIVAGTSIAAVGTYTNHDFRLVTDGSDRMTLDTSGRVGVGLTTVSATFDVIRGNGTATAQFRGTNHNSIFNSSTTEDTYIRGGKSGAVVFVNDAHIGDVLLCGGGGKVGVGIGVAPTGKVDVDQTSTTAAIPVLRLRQGDDSEEFIDFIGNSGAGNPIQTSALGAFYGKIRVAVNSTFKFLALYDS